MANYDEVTVDILAEAFEKAVQTAYKAVMQPKEGTILTVARGAADKAAEMIDFIRSKTYSDFVLLWEGSMSESPTWYLRKNIGTDNVALEAVVKQEAWSRDLRALRSLLEDKPYPEN